MANNPNLYNAVIAGATGANQQRWLTDSVQANYASFQASIVALAGAVDAAVDPVSGDINTAQAALMQSIVQGVFADRFVQSTSQASYESIVGPIVALWNELSESLEPAPSATTFEPLSMLYWVDPLTAVEASAQNGFEGTPFETLQQGFDAALAAQPAGVPCLALLPTSYTGGITDSIGVDISLAGFGKTLTNSGALIGGDLTGTNGTAWALTDVIVSGEITTTSTVRMIGGGQLGSPGIQCNSLIAEEGAVIENATANSFDIKAGSTITNCTAENLFTPGFVFLVDSTISVLTGVGGANLSAAWSRVGTIASMTDVTLKWCDVSIIEAETVNLENCVVTGGSPSITCTTLTIDSVTYRRAEFAGTVFNVSGSIIISDSPPPSPLSIVVTGLVPAVAADAVGYLNISLVGTALQDTLAQNSVIIVNPQSDLVAAGAGGGFLNARMSAANTLRLCFQGALAGGNADFTVTSLDGTILGA